MKNIILLSLLSILGCEPSKLEVTDNAGQEAIEEEIEIPCGYEIGDFACDFTLVDSRGDDVNLHDFKGDIIVLDFSTAWCYYCQMLAFDAQPLQDEHGHLGFTYVTVLLEGFDRLPPTQDLLVEWETHFGITTSPVLAGDSSLIDLESQAGWMVEAYPTMYYIDRDLKIVEYQRGFSQAMMNATIDSLLAKE